MFFRKKKNQGNTLRSAPEPTKNAKKDTPSRKISFKKITDPFENFFSNERNMYVLGLLSILFAVFLLFSFTSFFFSWEQDQDKIETWSTSGIEVFTDNYQIEDDAQNIMGTIGAKIANFFIYKSFGVASYGIPIILLLSGIKWAFKKEILPYKKSIRVTIIAMVWSSLLFGSAFSSFALNPGGNFGYQIYLWLSHLAGGFGVAFILFFSAFIISRLEFDFKIESLFAAKDRAESESVENDFSENIAIPTPTVRTVLPDLEVKKEPEIITKPEEEIIEENFQAANELEITPAGEAEIITEEEEVAELEETSNEIELDSAPISSPPKKESDQEVSFEVETTDEKEILLTEAEINKKVEEFGEYDPTLDLGSYKFPTIDLLNQYEIGGGSKVDMETLETNKNNIIETLRNYKIEISSIKATIGPTITLYEIVPAPGIRISKIKNLEDDIALSLAALGIRIIAPIPGKGTVGIEVPNPKPDIVSMHTVISSKAFQESKMQLPIALGKTITNETFTIDLAKMPHLLMAGATGQGKSVGLNAILVSLLYKKHPSQLKLVLVDPKKVELTLFNKVVRHFLAKLPDTEEPIITDTQKVVATVNSLCVEMDNRYEMLKNAHCRNIIEYNEKFKKRKLNPEKGHKFLPYIVLVIDEFADLIMTAGKEIETPIARLAQLARAIGIHLIVATQRPSVNIITGTIKANFPCRIAFRVTSKIDSRTILDAGGADQLIGRGDMLLSTGNELIRIQCAFVDTPEVEKICDYIGEQRGYTDAHLLPEYDDPNGETGSSSDVNLDERDALFEDAARVIVLHQQGSASLLQRKLKLGYNRAGRIVDQLEAAGIIGQFEGSKARQVLIPDEYSLEQLLNTLNNRNN